LIRVSGAFDEAFYRAEYADVRDPAIDPIVHWVDIGSREGRHPSDPSYLNPTIYGILDKHLHGIPSASPAEPGWEIAKRAIWGLAADAEIRCLKPPSFEDEVALFATYSPHGWLKPHVLHYIESLRREGIAVVLIVNAEAPLRVSDADLLPRVDGLFVRQAKGYDFAAWAHVLQLRREIFDASLLYLINDSVIGPIDQLEFRDLLRRIRDSKADVVGLTESVDRVWHLQSFFLVFKRRALLSTAFEKFFAAIVCYEDKWDVITHYELRLETVLREAGLDCEAMFRAIDALNTSVHHWRELLDAGFPFVKVEVARNMNPGVNTDGCLEIMRNKGFDVRLV
jgi:hypothetical protein